MVTAEPCSATSGRVAVTIICLRSSELIPGALRLPASLVMITRPRSEHSLRPLRTPPYPLLPTSPPATPAMMYFCVNRKMMTIGTIPSAAAEVSTRQFPANEFM